MEGDHRATTPERLLADAGWLRRIAVSLVGEGAAADDLVQETWIAALLRSRDPSRVGGDPPRAWLAAVVRNFGRQRLRSEASRRHREERTARVEALPSPEELVGRMEQQRLLAEAITRLDEPYRSTVILRYTDDLEPSEIARRQGLPPGTVRRRLKVGLDRLREDLDRRYGGRDAWVSGLLPIVGLRPEELLAAAAKSASIAFGIVVMKKLAVALIAVAAAACIWNFVRGGAGSPMVSGTAAVPSDLAAPADDAPLGADALEAVDSEAARSRALTLAVAERDDVVVVTGQVHLPPGCADDPTLEVFALSYPSSYGGFVRRLDRAPHGAAIDGFLLARADVDADGRFEIPFPAATDFGHLIARGRYLFTRDSVQVEPRAGESVELAPSTGAWITGRTVPPADDGATNLSGDGVFLGALASIDVGTGILGNVFGLNVTTQADGSFEFRAVPSDVEYTVIVAPDRWAAQRGSVAELTACGRTPLLLELETGRQVRGTVLDGSGDPVPNAWVAGYLPGSWMGFDDVDVRRTVTRADGTFELEALPFGAVLVRAGADGQLESEKARVEPGDADVDGLVLRLENGRSIAGTLTLADGDPAEAARVSTAFDRSALAGDSAFNALRGAEGSASSDDAGHFRVTGLGDGPFTVTCETEQGGLRYRARRDGVSPGDELEITLYPPLALAGRVTDEGGRPVPRFQVSAARVVEGSFGALALDRREQAFLSEQGEFALQDLVDGTWEVTASGSGHVTADPVRVALPRPAGSEAVLLTTVPAASVSGVVLSSDGVPVPGAEVRRDTSEPAWVARVAAGRVTASTRTDGSGRFVLDGLVPGPFAILAESREHGRSRAATVDLVPGSAASGIELRLTLGGVLTGEVIDADGNAGTGCMVYVEHLTTAETALAASDAAGRFTFRHLEPGTWQVVAVEAREARAAGGGDFDFDSRFDNIRAGVAEIVEGETTRIVLGGPPDEPVTVSGSVRSAGAPHAGAWILFLPSPPDPTASMKIDTIGADGRYEITLDHPGQYGVSIQRPGTAEETIDYVRSVPAVAQHRIVFELPVGRISGRIVGPDGSAAAGARVALFADGTSHEAEYHQGSYYESAADADGTYSFDNLKSGVFTIMAGGAHALAGQGEAFARVARGDLELAVSGSLEGVDFRLPGHGAVDVRVVDDQAEPVEGATVFARDAGGSIVDPLSSTVTDATGRCTLDGLAPGTYALLARGGGRAGDERVSVDVVEGGTTTAELRIGPGTMLRVGIRDESGRAARGWVGVYDADDREVGGMYAMAEIYDLYYQGVFSPSDPAVGPLPPGTYRVEATAFGGLAGSSSVTVRGEPKVETTVRVE